MKYILILFGLVLLSCSVLNEKRIKCIEENFGNLPHNNESMLIDECLVAFIDEYLNYKSDIKYYFHDSFEEITSLVKIDTNKKFNKILIDIFPKIEEALFDLSNNKDIPAEISFNSMINFKSYNSFIPISCNENFTVRDGWELSLSKPGLSKDSTICCIIVRVIQCGFGCWFRDLIILQKINNKWKLKEKVILRF